MSTQNYASQNPNSYIDKLVLKKRLEMYKIFMHEFPEKLISHVLDAGVTAEKNSISSNFFEENFPSKNKIIALSNQNAIFLEKVYPGLKFQSGDAKNLPFDDDSIDVVFSSAVLEHVGSLTEQIKMVQECFRVCKKGLFITTPNRWYPIDLHTSIPFIHWLPKNWHRKILMMLGLKFFSLEENLNLLKRKDILFICKKLNIKHIEIKKIKTFGFVSNLILVIKK